MKSKSMLIRCRRVISRSSELLWSDRQETTKRAPSGTGKALDSRRRISPFGNLITNVDAAGILLSMTFLYWACRGCFSIPCTTSSLLIPTSPSRGSPTSLEKALFAEITRPSVSTNSAPLANASRMLSRTSGGTLGKTILLVKKSRSLKDIFCLI